MGARPEISPTPAIAQAGPPAAMRDAIAALGLPFGRERSVRISGGRASGRRRLYSVPVRALGADPRAGLAAFLDRIAAPKQAFAMLAAYAGAAAHLHAGWDCGGAGCLSKVYLEFDRPPPRARDLVFLAAKWTAGGPCLRATYERRDAGAARALFGQLAGPEIREPVDEILALAARRAPPRALEVADAGTPRRSLDFNLYDAGLCLADAAAPIRALYAQAGPGGEAAERFLAAESRQVLGHLAIGRGRDDAAFVTLHFGAAEAR